MMVGLSSVAFPAELMLSTLRRKLLIDALIKLIG